MYVGKKVLTKFSNTFESSISAKKLTNVGHSRLTITLQRKKNIRIDIRLRPEPRSSRMVGKSSTSELLGRLDD